MRRRAHIPAPGNNQPAEKKKGDPKAAPKKHVASSCTQPTSSELLRLHEPIERTFREPEPRVLVRQELGVIRIDLLPLRIGIVQVRIDLLRRLERCIHHILRERPQLGARAHELLDRHGVARVVLGQHRDVGVRGSGFHHGLVLGRQAFPGLGVDVEVQLRAAFPPAGVVVERRHLVEAQLLVVVRAHPLQRVDRALFQRGVQVGARNRLRDHTEGLQHPARERIGAELQALEVGDGLDLLAEPAAHLSARVAAGEADDVVLGVELAHQLQAVALVHPGVHLPGVEAEGHGAAQAERRVLAIVVVGRRVRHLDGGVLHAVHHAEGRHQFAAGMHRDLELAASGFADLLGEHFRRAIDGVERLGEAGREAPADAGLGMHSGGCAGCQHAGDACVPEDGTTIHGWVSGNDLRANGRGAPDHGAAGTDCFSRKRL